MDWVEVRVQHEERFVVQIQSSLSSEGSVIVIWDYSSCEMSEFSCRARKISSFAVCLAVSSSMKLKENLSR